MTRGPCDESADRCQARDMHYSLSRPQMSKKDLFDQVPKTYVALFTATIPQHGFVSDQRPGRLVRHAISR